MRGCALLMYASYVLTIFGSFNIILLLNYFEVESRSECKIIGQNVLISLQLPVAA